MPDSSRGHSKGIQVLPAKIVGNSQAIKIATGNWVKIAVLGSIKVKVNHGWDFWAIDTE